MCEYTPTLQKRQNVYKSSNQLLQSFPYTEYLHVTIPQAYTIHCGNRGVKRAPIRVRGVGSALRFTVTFVNCLSCSHTTPLRGHRVLKSKDSWACDIRALWPATNSPAGGSAAGRQISLLQPTIL